MDGGGLGGSDFFWDRGGGGESGAAEGVVDGGDDKIEKPENRETGKWAGGWGCGRRGRRRSRVTPTIALRWAVRSKRWTGAIRPAINLRDGCSSAADRGRDRAGYVPVACVRPPLPKTNVMPSETVYRQEEAVKTVLAQAGLLCAEWV